MYGDYFLAENSGIVWTDHTFNPWIGCTKVSRACKNCYASVWDNRFGGQRWGRRAARVRTKTWAMPLRWNRIAEAEGRRQRVFCASLADVFDDHVSIESFWRSELWRLIVATPWLDWLMLTKRPENIGGFLPPDWGVGYPNVWLGVSAECQETFDWRVPRLEKIPAVVRFASMEPLQGVVDLRGGHGLDWVIVGGESGSGCGELKPEWVRAVRDQCMALDVAFLFKQWSGRTRAQIDALGREVDGVLHDGYPARG